MADSENDWQARYDTALAEERERERSWPDRAASAVDFGLDLTPPVVWVPAAVLTPGVWVIRRWRRRTE